MSLSSRDYQRVLDTIEIIYGTSGREQMFTMVCEQLEKAIGIDSAVFLPIDKGTGGFDFSGHFRYRVDRENVGLFCSHYAPVHPLIATGQLQKLLRSRQRKKVVRLTEVIPAYRLEQTEYFYDFQRRHPIFYELGSALGVRNDFIGGFCVHRSRKDRDFTPRDEEMVNLLVPHLSRAYRNIALILPEKPEKEAMRSRLSLLELTPRQQEVALLLTEGVSNRRIAQLLCISEQTVKDHVSAILEQSGVRRRGELTAKIMGLRSSVCR